MSDDGMINIWVDLKRAIPDIHENYAKSVTEYATDPKGGEDCPPLNIVIFIVGSRGEYHSGAQLLEAHVQVMYSRIYLWPCI